jgi:prevent-host-death family protein
VEVSVSDAKAQITELVRRAEAGEEVVLTRFGRPVARITAIAPRTTAASRRAALEAARASGQAAASPGPGGARSQDFLYDEDGLPR